MQKTTRHICYLKCAVTLLTAFAMVITSVCLTGVSQASAAAKKYVASLKVAKAPSSMKVGQSKKLKVTVKVKKKASKKFTVKSSKKAVLKASVSGSGIKLTAKKEGKATITVTTKAKGKKGKKLSKKFTVKVTKASTGNNNNSGNQNPDVVTRIVLSADRTSINVGDTVQLSAAVVPSTAKTNITWESSNGSIAVVDQSGRVTGRSSGTVDITAYADNGVAGKLSISVNAVRVTGVTLDTAKLDMTVAQTTTLKETVQPTNATNRSVTWTSSNTEVASVERGKVTAISAGTAEIAVETADGGYRATAVINVTEDSSKDVNGMTVSVTNSLKDYPNTVLVGTQAKINVKAMKDGKPYGGDSVNVQLRGVSGYTEYYELSKSDVDLNDEGIGVVYVRLRNGCDYKPVFSDWKDAAYASFQLTFTSGGANFTETQTLSFAQILPQTANSFNNGEGKALSVENSYDPDLQWIQVTNSNYATGVSQSVEGYEEEYVIDQQVSSDQVQDGNHEVVLDAAPLLIRSDTLGGSKSDTYSETNIGYSSREYSVYAGVEDKAYTLEDVPGGLQYLTLSFDELKLSKYTRIVVRAYAKDTNIPLVSTSTGELVEQIITDDTIISSNTTGNTVQIGMEIFGKTWNFREIDIKIFVESAGQVSEDDNVGFSLTKAEGRWENTEVKIYDYVPMQNCVTWSCESNAYTGEKTLPDAEQYLGSFYNKNNTYKYATPTFPNIGNAIIIAYDSNNNASEYYLYPTRSTENHNANELMPAGRGYVFKGTIDQKNVLNPVNYSKEITEDGKLKIDSLRAGYVQVQAHIQVFETDKDKYAVDYTLNSFIQWSPNAGSDARRTQDFYAIAGQTVTLTATVTDANGNIVPDLVVRWEGTEDLENITVHGTSSKTDSNGQVQVTLTSPNNVASQPIIPVVSSSRKVTWKISDITVPEDTSVVIHWVKPGIYYKNSVEGIPDVVVEEYNTSNDTSAVVLRNSNVYKNGTTWILGTKVVGADIRDTDGNIVEIIDISNIGINMTAGSSSGITSDLNRQKNGVYKITCDKTGNVEITASISGLIDEDAKCVITVMDQDGNIEHHTSVGEKTAIEKGADLKIPIQWIPNGAKLSLVNYNKNFDINNDSTKKAIVYVQVKDINGNAVPDVEVSYTVTDRAGTPVRVNVNGVRGTGTARTNANGTIGIEMPTPNSVDTYTVVANITNDTSVTQNETTTVKFSENQSDFTLTEQTPTAGSKEITLTFNSALDSDIEENGVQFFTVQDRQGKTVDIASVELVSSNRQQLKIYTMEDITSEAVVSIQNTYTGDLDGFTHYLLNADGVLFTNN